VKLRRAQVETLDSPGPKRRLAVSLVNLGNLESALGKGSVAAGHYREALTLVPEDDATTRALLLFNLGVDHQVAGRDEQALSHYRKALALAERVHPASHPRVVGSRMGVGSMLVALGRPAEAREPLERALLDWPANMRGSLDEAELDFALAQAHAAAKALDASERRRAVELAERAEAIYRKAKLDAEAERVAAWMSEL
jgi:tetratricopeptide (TPR) repeat protein